MPVSYTHLDVYKRQVQDVVSYAQEVSDSINGYVKMKVSYGSCQIVKTLSLIHI